MGRASEGTGPAVKPTLVAPPSQRQALRAWESEGGSLASAEAPQPSSGIEVIAAAQYRVGPYRYTDLACAEAELHRQQGRSRR